MLGQGHFSLHSPVFIVLILRLPISPLLCAAVLWPFVVVRPGWRSPMPGEWGCAPPNIFRRVAGSTSGHGPPLLGQQQAMAPTQNDGGKTSMFQSFPPPKTFFSYFTYPLPGDEEDELSSWVRW